MLLATVPGFLHAHPLLVVVVYTAFVVAIAFYVGWREQLRLDDELWAMRRLPREARDWEWPECEREAA